MNRIGQRKKWVRILEWILLILFIVAVSTANVHAFSIEGTYKAMTGYPGVKKFNYAATPVRENFVTSDMVDAEYTFRLGSKAVDEYFGKTGTWTHEGYTYKGFYLKDNTKEKCGVRYNKLFQYNNTWIDVKTTYMNWSLKDKKKAFFGGGFCRTDWTNVKWLRMKHEFFLAGTNTPVNVKGFFTFTDVDDNQGLAIPEAQIKKIWVNSGSTILGYKKEDGKVLIKDRKNVLIPNKSHSDYTEAKAATATFSYQFEGKTHTQYILDGNADNSGNTIGFDAAKYIPSAFPPPKPPAIDKRIYDSDEANVAANTIPSIKDSWTYYVNGLVPLETEPGNFYDGFRFEDTIDSCLQIKGASVYQDGEKNVSGNFSIAISGQKVTATSKTYRTDAFYAHNYALRIQVGIKPDITESTLASHGHFNANKTSLTFKNTGTVIYTDGNGDSKKTSPTVTTTVQLPKTSSGAPGLNITKSVSKEEWQVGDYVPYTVNVSQSNPAAVATNVVVTDTSLPTYMKVKENTFRVTGVSGASMIKAGNGFRVTIPRLAYGQTATITFQALARKGAANQTIPNTAKAAADLIPEKSANAKIKVKPYDIEGKKSWDDEDDNDGFRPETVTVYLNVHGIVQESQKISAQNGWRYRFENLEKYDEDEKQIDYTITEEKIDKYTLTTDGYNLTNKHIPEKITVEGKKTWNDANDYDQLRPNQVVITLYADGKAQQSQTVSAKTNWSYRFENLYKYRKKKQVDYTIREKEVNHYNTTYSKAASEYDRIEWNTTNTHVPYAIRLTKTELLEDGTQTSTPVANAIYELHQIDPDQKDRSLGQYTTDEKGTFFAKGLTAGQYYLKEVKEPYGYSIRESRIDVRIQPAENQEIKSVQISEVKTADQRKYGQIQLYKKDNAGNSVANARFGLFSDSSCKQKIGEYETDNTGIFTIKNLKWRTYYLKELTAPKGYDVSKEVHTVTIGKDTTLTATVEAVNQQKRGSVELTKTDDTEKLRLKGAVFDLYRIDGTLVAGNLITDENGKLLVKDLAWGSYYFKETKAPTGYGISQNQIRFSVNATTGGIKQEVQALNSPKMGEIRITKRILAEDLHYDHGVPTFLFHLTGTTVDKEKKSYVQAVTFSKEYVKNHTNEKGYVEGTVTFNKLKAGTYICKEQDAIRYKLQEITELSSNATKNAQTVEFDMTSADTGSATFLNQKEDWRDYSDSTNVMNLVKAKKKLTAIIADYTGPEVLEGNSFFDRSMLTVTAVYDDGTEKKLDKEAYILLNGDGTALDHLNKVAGSYTAVVQYTERGITRRGTFTYRVENAKRQTVHFVTNGGDPLGDLLVFKYDSLKDYSEEKTIPVRNGYAFQLWYLDQALNTKFLLTDSITKDLTLYASWEAKHLNACSWNEIKTLSDSGKAEAHFKDCYQTVKEDLKDGQLSAGNFEHTKEFTCGGKTYHAVIAGFDHDTKSSGGKAGISFLTYELADPGRMNDSTKNQRGWKESSMRTVTLQELYASLPADLRTVIAPVQKRSACKINGTLSITATEDKLWLPSQVELYGSWGYLDTGLSKAQDFGNTDYGALQSIKGEGTQYPIFQASVPDGILYKEAALATGQPYWTRSLLPTLDSANGFCLVDDLGGAK